MIVICKTTWLLCSKQNHVAPPEVKRGLAKQVATLEIRKEEHLSDYTNEILAEKLIEEVSFHKESGQTKEQVHWMK